MSDHALVIGEALIDLVRRADGTTESFVGGSPANVAIGLARLERKVELLTWIGLDDNGRDIREHMEDAGVELVKGSESALRTSISSATIDQAGAASYEFDLQWALNPGAATTRRPVIVHTGSIAAILRPGSETARDIIRKSRGTATITYDPNIRPSLMGNPITASALVDQMIEVSDVVKVSDEDLEWLHDDTSVEDQARHWLNMGPALVVVTRRGKGATAFTRDGRKLDVTAPRVKVADTVGAGDSFMSGLIDGLWGASLLGADKREWLGKIDSEMLNYVLNRCVGIAAITVSRKGANPPTRADLGEG